MSGPPRPGPLSTTSFTIVVSDTISSASVKDYRGSVDPTTVTSLCPG